MRKILLLALLLSIAVYALTQDQITIGDRSLVYQVPILYPVLVVVWLFFGGVAVGLQWNSWEKYRMRSQIRYYQTCSLEAEKRLDEARWLVCESVRGHPLLKIREVAEDYQAMMSSQGDRLDQMRYHDAEVSFPSNRVIEQALKNERKIHMALQAEDPIEALHHLQALPWDLWSHPDSVHYILKSWDRWSEPVRVFLIAKIGPSHWSPQNQQALLKTIQSDRKPEKWFELLRKAKWRDESTLDPRLLQELEVLA